MYASILMARLETTGNNLETLHRIRKHFLQAKTERRSINYTILKRKIIDLNTTLTSKFIRSRDCGFYFKVRFNDAQKRLLITKKISIVKSDY